MKTDMVSDSATKPSSQQASKAYTDAVGARVTTIEGYTKVLHTDVLSDATDYSTTGTSMVQMSGIFTKTPESGSSNLRGVYTAGFTISENVRKQMTTGGQGFQTYYRDSGGTWTDIGASVFVGTYKFCWIINRNTLSRCVDSLRTYTKQTKRNWRLGSFAYMGKTIIRICPLNVYQAQVYMVEAEN